MPKFHTLVSIDWEEYDKYIENCTPTNDINILTGEFICPQCGNKFKGREFYRTFFPETFYCSKDCVKIVSYNAGHLTITAGGW